MPLLILFVLIFLVVGVGVVAAGLGAALPAVSRDRGGALLPVAPMRREDVEDLRFSLGLRGYRMDEVDDVLDRLADELEERDRRIEELQSQLGATETAGGQRVPGGSGDPAVPGPGGPAVPGPGGPAVPGPR